VHIGRAELHHFQSMRSTPSARSVFSANSAAVKIATTKDATAECKSVSASSVTIDKHCDAECGRSTLFDADNAI